MTRYRIRRFAPAVMAAITAAIMLSGTEPGAAAAAVPDSNATAINVRLPHAPVAFSGTLRRGDDSAPVADANVDAIDAITGRVVGGAYTETDGKWKIVDLPHGHYRLGLDGNGEGTSDLQWGFYRASGPGHFTPVMSHGTVLSYTGSAVTGRDVALPVGYTISGTITKAGTGVPLENITVNAVTAASGATFFGDTYANTDASGHYKIVGLSNRSYTLHLARGYLSTENIQTGCYRATAVHHFTADCSHATSLQISGASLPGKSLGLPTGLVITGAIKDRTGGGDLCAFVSATRQGSIGSASYASACGVFALDGLAPGRYIVNVAPAYGETFVPGAYSSANAHHWVPSTATPTTIALSADRYVGPIKPSNGHTVSGQVQDKNGAPLAAIYVDVLTMNGHVVATDTTAVDGSYVARGVANGTYRVSVHPSPGTNIQSGWYDSEAAHGFSPHKASATTITVSADVTGIDMRVPPGYTISGRITDPGGHGVQAAVIGTGPGAPTSAVLYSGPDGTYHLVGYAPGKYRIDVIASTGGILAPGWYSATAAGHYSKTKAHATVVIVGP